MVFCFCFCVLEFGFALFYVFQYDSRGFDVFHYDLRGDSLGTFSMWQRGLLKLIDLGVF